MCIRDSIHTACQTQATVLGMDKDFDAIKYVAFRIVGVESLLARNLGVSAVSYTHLEHHCSDGVQREEPTACLVHPFGDEIGRIYLVAQLTASVRWTLSLIHILFVVVGDTSAKHDCLQVQCLAKFLAVFIHTCLLYTSLLGNVHGVVVHARK